MHFQSSRQKSEGFVATTQLFCKASFCRIFLNGRRNLLRGEEKISLHHLFIRGEEKKAANIFHIRFPILFPADREHVCNFMEET